MFAGRTDLTISGALLPKKDMADQMAKDEKRGKPLNTSAEALRANGFAAEAEAQEAMAQTQRERAVTATTECAELEAALRPLEEAAAACAVAAPRKERAVRRGGMA